MTAMSIVDRRSAVLVLIDLQERLAAAMKRRAAVLDATGVLVRAAVLTGVPIVATRQYPAGLGDIEPVLRAALETAASDTSVAFSDKIAFDCFADPEFSARIAQTGRSQLVIAGMESHICVTQTALSALREGHDVHVVADACCSRHDYAHEIALARLRTAGAVVTVTESALYELVGIAGTEEFRALLRIVKE
jgi:nicotinamidase-related amidase